MKMERLVGIKLLYPLFLLSFLIGCFNGNTGNNQVGFEKTNFSQSLIDKSESKTRTDREEMNLQGEVRCLIEKTDGSERIYVFTKDGMFENVISFISLTHSVEEMTYKYIEGKLLSVSSKSANNNSEPVTTEMKIFYDEKGRKVGTQIGRLREIINYYDNGEIEELIMFDQQQKDSCFTFFYYNGKDLDSVVSFSSDRYDNNSFINKGIYTKDRLIYEESYKGGITRKLLSTVKHLYDALGNEVETRYTYFDGENENWRAISNYKYDAVGNWIERIEIIDIDGEETMKTERTIFYESDDYRNALKRYNEMVSTALSGSNNRYNSDQVVVMPRRSIPETSNSKHERCWKCSGNGKCSSCNTIFRVDYHDNNGHLKSRNETRLGYKVCTACSGKGYIGGGKSIGGYNKSEKCYVSACMNGWIFCSECNYIGKGKNLGSCSLCFGDGYRN